MRISISSTSLLYSKHEIVYSLYMKACRFALDISFFP